MKRKYIVYLANPRNMPPKGCTFFRHTHQTLPTIWDPSKKTLGGSKHWLPTFPIFKYIFNFWSWSWEFGGGLLPINWVQLFKAKIDKSSLSSNQNRKGCLVWSWTLGSNRFSRLRSWVIGHQKSLQRVNLYLLNAPVECKLHWYACNYLTS